jgi:hypothetical protein
MESVPGEINETFMDNAKKHPQRMNTTDESAVDILSHYHVRKVFGKGGEGTVYLVDKEGESGQFVLKIFHELNTVDWIPGLPVYASKIKANDLGLPEVKIIFRGEKIAGVLYPYVQLNSLHWRILQSNEQVAQSVVGSYCKKQFYLMSQHDLTLYDPALPNLMVDKNGKWHYCDMGGGIGLLDSTYIHERGLLGFGFASLLLSIYNKTLYHLMMPREDYSYDIPCSYCQNEWLDTIAAQHGWVKEILSEVCSHKSSIFYDPEFYRQLGDRLPDCVPLPSMILPLSKTFTLLGNIRGKLGL